MSRRRLGSGGGGVGAGSESLRNELRKRDCGIVDVIVASWLINGEGGVWIEGTGAIDGPFDAEGSTFCSDGSLSSNSTVLFECWL